MVACSVPRLVYFGLISCLQANFLRYCIMYTLQRVSNCQSAYCGQRSPQRISFKDEHARSISVSLVEKNIIKMMTFRMNLYRSPTKHRSRQGGTLPVEVECGEEEGEEDVGQQGHLGIGWQQHFRQRHHHRHHYRHLLQHRDHPSSCLKHWFPPLPVDEAGPE